jgi:hypothetical protein
MGRRTHLALLAAVVGSALAGPAAAADLTASSLTPAVFFDATQFGLPGSAEWAIYASTFTTINAEDLAIDDQQTFNNVILLRSSANNGGSLVVEANGDLSLANGAMSVDRDARRVGIGTTAPQGSLHIAGTATQDLFAGIGPDLASGPALNFGYSGASFGRGSGFFNVRPDAAAIAPNPSLRFATGNVQRMIITSTGNVGIGTTSPSNPLQMASGARVTAGGVWTDASSREYKQEIAPLSAGAARAALEQLAPVTFAYRADPAERHVGFVAEDVPALVATADRKGLSPMDIVAVLTRVVQEQQRTSEAQQRRLHDQQRTIAELAARLAALEGAGSR